MRAVTFLLVMVYCLQAAVTGHAADPPSLDPHLEPLRPLLGKTWKGTLTGGKADKPVVDIMCWERALNGKAVRILHSINDGVYGGETILRWNAKKQTVAYHYFTTEDYLTVGEMTVDGGRFSTRETVEGSGGGVTEVRATMELRPDGTLHLKAEYCKDGKWQPGHEVTYREDPAAKVVFR